MRVKSNTKFSDIRLVISATSCIALLFCTMSGSFAAQPKGPIVPLYNYDANIDGLIAAKQHYPSVDIIAILNPDSGPGDAKDDHWTGVVGKLHAAHIRVVGYVDTAYAGVSQSDADSRIDMYYNWYGVDGIFFDDATPDNHDYYQALTHHAKTGAPGKLSIINPGAAVPGEYADAADIVIVYENDAVPSGIETSGLPSSHVGVLVHGTDDSGSVFDAVKDSAGYVYTSPDWGSVAPDIVDQAKRMS